MTTTVLDCRVHLKGNFTVGRQPVFFAPTSTCRWRQSKYRRRIEWRYTLHAHSTGRASTKDKKPEGGFRRYYCKAFCICDERSSAAPSDKLFWWRVKEQPAERRRNATEEPKPSLDRGMKIVWGKQQKETVWERLSGWRGLRTAL